MTASPTRGRLLWYELMTSDLKAAEAFYTNVVGWTITPFEGGPGPYSMWTRAGDTPIGGAMAMPDEMKAHGVPPHWMIYVGAAPSLEAVRSDAERLGGGVLSPVIDVPGVGRMQALKDPQGAAFSIYEPAAPSPREEALPEVGDASWIELFTTNIHDAMGFYHDLLGWQKTEAMEMGPMGTYQMFGRHLGSFGGMMNKTPEMAQMPTAWMIYFRVPDVHSAIERVKAGGGQVLSGPMEVPGGDWVAQCMDPQGAAFGIHHKKA
jgi:uncharacterized protein